VSAPPPEASGLGKMRHFLKVIAAMAFVITMGLIASWYLRFVFAGPTPAEYVANHPGTKLVPEGQLSFDGEAFVCGRHPAVFVRNFEDYGAALFGFIILNPERFQTLPLAVKRFAYAHECGHQFVGYSETGADCYAVKRGLKDGWLDAGTLEEICAFFSKSKGGAFHLPGPQRCAFIRACYAAST
jgi:hypothetical protein